MTLVTTRERELLDAVAAKAGWAEGYEVTAHFNYADRRHADLHIEGQFSLGDDMTARFSAWLPLAVLHVIDWPVPAIWELSDAYGAAPPPEMEPDWSGIRDSEEETKWKMFEIAERILMGPDVAAYVKSGGGMCPFCGSGEIEGGSFDVEGDSCGQEVS